MYTLYRVVQKELDIRCLTWCFERQGTSAEPGTYRAMRRKTKFRSTTDRLYNGGPIKL